MAITSRTWMNPPNAVLVTSPNAQRTMRIMAMVINIILVLLVGIILASVGGTLHQLAGLSRGVFDMVTHILDVVPKTMDRSTTATKKCRECGG